MSLYLDDGDVRLYHGDALEQLALMPSESVQCIVTSPPFWGLRDYGTPGQIGLEETPDEWCAKLVAVMREARRVLRSDGVCWIEVGDTYNANYRTGADAPNSEIQRGNAGTAPFDSGIPHSARRVEGIKPKDLVGAPWILAFALRADGWYLRSDTIWARPNPMPESVTDRPTKAHSYVFLLSKAARYYYDADAIREGLADPTRESDPYPGAPNHQPNGSNVGLPGGYLKPAAAGGRNARSVWNIPTEPTPFAHFATFPQALVERCIKAGTSEHGACSECGAPWRRIVEMSESDYARTQRETGTTYREMNAAARTEGKGQTHVGQTRGADGKTMTYRSSRGGTLGWEPSCPCEYDADGGYLTAARVVPCVVLDPFMGSGTTALVARRLGRHAIGIELNAEYLAISAKRLQQLSLFGGTEAVPETADPVPCKEKATCPAPSAATPSEPSGSP